MNLLRKGVLLLVRGISSHIYVHVAIGDNYVAYSTGTYIQNVDALVFTRYVMHPWHCLIFLWFVCSTIRGALHRKGVSANGVHVHLSCSVRRNVIICNNINSNHSYRG